MPGPAARRRAALAVQANPARHVDYLICLEGKVETALGSIAVELSYVPDPVILAPDVFVAYLDALTQEPWNSLEEMGAAALADIESEALPRYLRLALRSGKAGHDALFEGRQPNWKNDGLLARLG